MRTLITRTTPRFLRTSLLLTFALPMLPAMARAASTTTDWTPQQGYLDAAPLGVDARWAWSIGVTGQGVALHEMEAGWTVDHEDFDQSRLFVEREPPFYSEAYHGTATVGEMVAADNGYGMTGIAFGVDGTHLYTDFPDPGGEVPDGRADAIDAATAKASVGDILVLEAQGFTCVNDIPGGPADYEQVVWDAIKRATDKGIIVFAAAGNASQNLEDPCMQAYNDRGDNLSILVGSSIHADRSPNPSSSYGSKVRLQGWGDGVYSLGYGDLSGDSQEPTTHYTAKFSGTSSATPIVAGAAILVQSWAKAKLGRPLTPLEMRELLIATGTPQAAGKHVGPLPNVRAAIETLAADNDITELAVAGTGGTDASGGSGGMTTGTGATSPSGSGGSGVVGANGGSPGTAGADGSADAGRPSDDEGAGCGCRVGGGAASAHPLLAALGVALVLLRRGRTENVARWS